MMNCHHVFRQRTHQILEQSPFGDFGVAVASHLIEVCEDDRLPHPACSIGCNQWVSFRRQHRARLDRFLTIAPVIPQAGKEKHITANGVSSLAATAKRLVETVCHQDTPLRRERPPETPRRVNRLAAGIKPFPLIFLSCRVIRRRLPVRRQPTPLPEFDNPLLRFRVTPDDRNIAHWIAVRFRQRIDAELQPIKCFGNLMQIRFGVVSVAHANTLTLRTSVCYSIRRNSPALCGRQHA